MSRAETSSADRSRTVAFVPRIAAGTVFAAVMIVIAAVAAWPIYRSGGYLLLVGVSVPVGALVAATAWLRRWNAGIVAGIVAAAMLLLGVPLAVPSRWAGPLDVLRGLGEVASGVVLGWKDLVTVELPVGTYRNLLVPALVIFLAGTCALLLLAWRADRAASLAVPVGLAMVSFGLFFGRPTVSAPLTVGPLTLHAPVETAIGTTALISGVLWLAWRPLVVRVSRRPSRADRRRTALGAALTAGAVALAVAIVPFAARGAERDVLRSAVGPDIDLSAELSPLSQYRSLFADDRAEQVLFVVEEAGGGSLPERVRIATLDAYDGEVFRAGGDGAVESGRFVRVPSALDAGEGREISARIEIDAWRGIWMPTAGQVETVEFTGDRSASLADRFYYNAQASAGVQTAGGGLRTGDAYTVAAVEPEAQDLTQLEAPGGDVAESGAPDSLRRWMDEHASGSGGAALAGLVSLLRERGYLSHGLVEGDPPPVWTRALSDYAFQPSASGHSIARVDAMFGRLLERETDPRAEASGNYVAAVGDDEQFAVAVALMARELGFPSRVVVGARLSAADPELPTCRDGVCRAQDIAAWTEVQSADGEWVAVDVTPQHAQSPALDVTEQRDPENVTEVRPDSVEEVVPPDPTQEDSASDDVGDDEAGPDLAWLGPVLRIAGISLLVLMLAVGPFAAVVVAKALRRRSRRRAGTPAGRIAGGWDEYVDAARDARRDVPRAATRTELAEAFATAAGPRLARDADRAVFSGSGVGDGDAEAYWASVDEERRALRSERGFWRGLAATVSLRSLVRPSASEQGVRTRIVERGRRRAQLVRPMP
jgi:hypothetical protein